MEVQSEYSEYQRSFVPQVSCCVCGILVESNPSNMCPSCLRSRVDITTDIQKEYIVQFCPECQRYLQPPKYWLRAELESKELLTLCLKRLKGINIASGSNSNFTRAKLVDAKFIWTEPHSKRIRLKLTVQKEVYSNIIIQQCCSIEYVVAWQLCPTCEKVATGQPQWDACVQLRQKAAHKKTFLYLEQLILKKRLHENFTRIEAQPDGLDFFFAHKSHALNFLEFLNKTAPVTRRDAVQLVSHDSKNNTAVQHYTYSLEISPLCREDLVLLPYKDYYLRTLSGLGPLVIVYKVYSSIVFLDPKTLRVGEITGSLYWKKPFQPLMNSREMVEFYVLECSLLPVTNGSHQQGLVTVCLSSEVGEGREWVVESHLGGLLHPGDLVKGYLLDSHTFNNSELDHYRPEHIQDVVLVRKHFESQQRRRNRRRWVLKKLDVVTAQGDEARIGRSAATGNSNRRGVADENEDELEFEDEVERDKELRRDINVFKATEADEKRRVPGEGAENDDDEVEDDAPEVALEEMLDELTLHDNEEAEMANAASTGDEEVDEISGYKKLRVE